MRAQTKFTLTVSLLRRVMLVLLAAFVGASVAPILWLVIGFFALLFSGGAPGGGHIQTVYGHLTAVTTWVGGVILASWAFWKTQPPSAVAAGDRNRPSDIRSPTAKVMTSLDRAVRVTAFAVAGGVLGVVAWWVVAEIGYRTEMGHEEGWWNVILIVFMCLVPFSAIGGAVLGFVMTRRKPDAGPPTSGSK